MSDSDLGPDGLIEHFRTRVMAVEPGSLHLRRWAERAQRYSEVTYEGEPWTKFVQRAAAPLDSNFEPDDFRHMIEHIHWLVTVERTHVVLWVRRATLLTSMHPTETIALLTQWAEYATADDNRPLPMFLMLELTR